MVVWDKIVFGTKLKNGRNSSVSQPIVKNDRTYVVSTVAAIETNEVTREPSVSASIQHSFLCVIIDNSIIIFENETCENILFNYNFESLITCYTMSKDKNLLFVVTKTGILHCFNLHIQQEVCFRIKIQKYPDSQIFYQNNDLTIIKLHLNVNETDIIVVADNGGTYRIPKLLQSLSIDFNLLNQKEVIAQIDTLCFEQVTGFDKNQVKCVADIKQTELALLSDNTQMLFLWPNRKKINLSTMPYKYTKIQFLKHSTAMICLRMDNKLSMVCSQTLLGLDVYDNSVIDFTIIDNDKSNKTQIIVITKPIHQQNTSGLLILSIPGFEQKLEIHVSNPVFLVDNLGIHSDITYLEGIANSAGKVQTLLIRTLREINQSLESTCYAQALRLSARLKCLSVEEFQATDLTTFIATLDKVHNMQNIISCCQEIILPDYKQMKILYLYIRRRILQYNVSSNRNDVQWDFLSNINNTIEKLETFEMICSFKLNDENLKSQAMTEWIRFSQGNLLEECKNQLRRGSLEAAALIWTRHLPSIMNNISVDALQDFLDSIPDLPIKLLLSWLSHFIPSLVYMLPDALNSIISWGCKRIKFLETSHLIDWPEIGLSFATNFLDLLKYEKGLLSPGNRQIFIGQNSYLQQLLLLVQALSDLCDLKAHHKIVVPLRIYLSDPLEVTHLLLDEVDIDKIPDLVDQFLKQYMLKYSLPNDQVFSSYIKRVLKNSRNQTSLGKTSWEQRLAIVIDFIYNIEIRLQGILDVLRRVPVPWSATIKNLVDSVSTLDHELAYEIKNEYNSVPVKLILKKYGYERIGVTEKLFRIIINMNRSEMIDDIDKLTKDNPLLKRTVLSMIISNCLLVGNLDAIIKILNSSEDKDVLFCVERIVNNISGLLSLEKLPPYIEHYMEILNWVKNKFQNISMKTSMNSYYCRTIEYHIEDVTSMYRLKKFFNVSATFTDFVTKKHAILENYVYTLCNGIEEQNLPILTLYDNVTKVAKLLKLPKKHAISLLLNVTDNIDTLSKFITARQADFNTAAEECGSIKELCAPILQNRRVNANIVSIMNVMSARAINSCSNEVLNANLSFSNIWSNLYCEISNRQALNNADNKGASRKKWKLYSIYADMAILLDDSLFCLLKDSFIVKLLSRGDYSLDLQKMFDTYEVSHINDLITELLNRSQLMQIDHNEYSLLQVMKTLHYCSCMSFTIDKVAKAGVVSYLRKIAIALLRKLVRTKSLDLQLGLCCLFMLPEEEARKWLSETCKLLQTNYSAHSATVTLGYEYFRLTKNEHLVQPFIYNKMVHQWAQKLANYSITYKELLMSDIASKKQILERIMSFKNDNVLSLVQDYCTHFGFSKDESLLLTYLKTLIKTWNPTWAISSLKGRRELCINQDEVTKLTKKCNDVVSLIKNKESLVQCIDALSSEVNFYYYEVFLLLMDISNEKNSDKKNYLHFLQKYIRKGRPTEIEEDAWRQLNVEGTTLPSIAEWRLPFLPEIDVWKFIAPELDLKTYAQWLDIAPVLKLQSNIICALAIKQEAHKIWANVLEKDKNNQWNLYQRNTSWLTDIKTCIERMTDPDSLYYGTAALYYVVNHTPPGADQVAAARECYICAQRAAVSCTMFKEELMDKIKSKYLRFTCEHILRTHDLGKEKYLKLTMNPNTLMRELYMDESIVLRYKTTTYRPDINSAVDALSKLFSTNLVKLRLELLHEWLQPDLKYGDINQSMTETVRVVRTADNNGIHDDNLLRACYMLQHGDIELSANFLIDIIFGDSNRMSRTHEERYRALYVLQSITSPEKLQDLTKRDLNSIKQHFTSLKYLGKLESWGFEVNIEIFQTCSKHELVQNILKTHCYSPQALTCLAQMCIDFKLHQYTLWDKILTQMTMLRMVSELKNILLETGDISVIVSCNGYIAGWQTIIDEPFKKMDSEPSSEQIDECINIVRVLQSCAVKHELQYTNILECCFQCNQPHLALSLIPFLRETDKQYVLERTCSTPYACKITEDLKALIPKGILTIPQSIRILNEALSKEDFDKIT